MRRDRLAWNSCDAMARKKDRAGTSRSLVDMVSLVIPEDFDVTHPQVRDWLSFARTCLLLRRNGEVRRERTGMELCCPIRWHSVISDRSVVVRPSAGTFDCPSFRRDCGGRLIITAERATARPGRSSSPKSLNRPADLLAELFRSDEILRHAHCVLTEGIQVDCSGQLHRARSGWRFLRCISPKRARPSGPSGMDEEGLLMPCIALHRSKPH